MSYSAGYPQHVMAPHNYAVQPVYTPPNGSSPNHGQQQPRPMYFITRTNGSTVPLIPADELPYSVRLEGVSRNMSPEQTYGLQFLGTLPFTGMVFKTKNDSPAMQRSTSTPTASSTHQRQYSNGKQYMAPDALARQATTNAAHHSYNNSASSITHQPGATTTITRPSTAVTTHDEAGTRTPAHTTLTNPQDVIDAILKSTSGAETAARVGYTPKATATTPPSGKVPDANKKEFCTYWIRTGECDFKQQGCMYKHEMPDPQKLKELGFRGTPRWWVEAKQAIRLGGGNGERATVGPVVKAKDWLRKESVASTESAQSSATGSDAETASTKSNGGKRREMEAKEVQEVSKGNGESVQAPEKKVLKKPAEGSKERATKPAPASDNTSSKAASTKSSIVSDNLIDFDTLEAASSVAAPAITPPTSTDSSPRVEPQATPVATPKPKGREIFVPKGESKTQHLADHHKRTTSLRRSKPSEAQVANLERHIQQAQKSKHATGLMASKHAVDAGEKIPRGREEKKDQKMSGQQGRRTPNGLRVRRPAPVIRRAELPMAGEKSKTEAKAKETEHKQVEKVVEKK